MRARAAGAPHALSAPGTPRLRRASRCGDSRHSLEVVPATGSQISTIPFGRRPGSGPGPDRRRGPGHSDRTVEGPADTSPAGGRLQLGAAGPLWALRRRGGGSPGCRAGRDRCAVRVCSGRPVGRAAIIDRRSRARPGPVRPGSGRDNGLGLDGWRAVMAALDGCTALTALGGVPCRGLVAGGLAELLVAGQEPGLALSLAHYLPRSAATLTALDMRCAEGRTPPPPPRPPPAPPRQAGSLLADSARPPQLSGHTVKAFALWGHCFAGPGPSRSGTRVVMSVCMGGAGRGKVDLRHKGAWWWGAIGRKGFDRSRSVGAREEDRVGQGGRESGEVELLRQRQRAWGGRRAGRGGGAQGADGAQDPQPEVCTGRRGCAPQNPQARVWICQPPHQQPQPPARVWICGEGVDLSATGVQ